jgi:hypothetical protein
MPFLSFLVAIYVRITRIYGHLNNISLRWCVVVQNGAHEGGALTSG